LETREKFQKMLEGGKALSQSDFESYGLVQLLPLINADAAILGDTVYTTDERNIVGVEGKEAEKRRKAYLDAQDSDSAEFKFREVVHALQWAKRRGKLDYSLSNEMAIAQSESRLDPRLPLRNIKSLLVKLSETSAWMGHKTEQYNRHVMAAASYMLAREEGLSDAEAKKIMESVIDDSMFNYSRMQRPELFRGKLGSIFVFQTYTQNALWALTGNSKGTGRMWMMLLLFGGLMGLPFAKDLVDIVDFLATYFKEKFGYKNPPTDLRRDLRETVKELDLNPDLILYGLGRDSFGITAAGKMTGAFGFPSFDLSGSLGMGDIIPMTEVPKWTLQGKDGNSILAQGAVDAAGAASQIPYALLQAILTDKADAWKEMESVLPVAAKSVSKAVRLGARGGEFTGQGKPVALFDVNDPVDLATLVGQALGFAPTKLTLGWEREMAVREVVGYWKARETNLRGNFYRALYEGDDEKKGEVEKMIKEFNGQVPFPEMQLSGKELAQGYVRWVKEREKAKLGINSPQSQREIEAVEAAFSSSQK
jgi:hypothetical protein